MLAHQGRCVRVLLPRARHRCAQWLPKQHRRQQAISSNQKLCLPSRSNVSHSQGQKQQSLHQGAVCERYRKLASLDEAASLKASQTEEENRKLESSAVLGMFRDGATNRGKLARRARHGSREDLKVANFYGGENAAAEQRKLVARPKADRDQRRKFVRMLDQ
jgi:hypothetical protein